MSCFIKLKEDAYIHWAKEASQPKSCILTKAQVEEIFLQAAKARKLLGHKEDFKLVWQRLETYGTTDHQLHFTLETILEKNHAGPGAEHLSLEQIFTQFNA